MTSVGTSLSFSTLDEDTMEIGRLKQRMQSGRTMSRVKKSKNKTRKKPPQVSSMLDYMHEQDEKQQKEKLEETFDMLKPTLTHTSHRDNDSETSDEEDDTPEFLKKRPLLDDSQSNDPIRFHDPKRYAQLVKEYGTDLLKPWASPDGPGQVPREERQKQVQRLQQQVQRNEPTSLEGFTGVDEQNTLYDSVSRDAVIDKMNYMIHLLEDQKDQRTESVNEELILYLFLGIFVIFITDSFTRVGKYTR